MGCDIHMYVEYKNNGGSDAEWRCGDYFHMFDPLSTDSKPTRIELYGERDYDLFAVLANVRNYEHIDYIEDPKGLPRDATEFVTREYSTWGFDAHSCSYFTLRELIDYDYEHDPRDSFGHYILKKLIDRLKRRADELNLIWDFERNGSSGREKALDKSNNIRIVFWFDN